MHFSHHTSLLYLRETCDKKKNPTDNERHEMRISCHSASNPPEGHPRYNKNAKEEADAEIHRRDVQGQKATTHGRCANLPAHV